MASYCFAPLPGEQGRGGWLIVPGQGIVKLTNWMVMVTEHRGAVTGRISFGCTLKVDYAEHYPQNDLVERLVTAAMTHMERG